MSSEHEVDVVALWWAVWDQKYLVIAIAAVCALIALFVGFTMTPVYRATVVVTPTNDQALSENSSLGGLASFAGLGLGYALGSRKLIPLFLAVPLLCWQFVLMLGLRYGLSANDRVSLKLLPFSEQLNMGLPAVDTLFNSVQTYLLLALVFLLTALAFIPIGQLCGGLLERREKLSAYGLNLAGSVVGVLLMFLLSAFWTPPVVWFLPAFALLLVFHARGSCERPAQAEGPLVSHEGRGFNLADCQGGGSARCSVASERLQLKPSIWPPPRRSDPAFSSLPSANGP